MNDQQVIDIIRRRMSFAEQELLVDPHVTAEQWVWAMTEYTTEMIRAFGQQEPPPVLPPQLPPTADAAKVKEAQSQLGKALDDAAKKRAEQAPADQKPDQTHPPGQAGAQSSRSEPRR